MKTVKLLPSRLEVFEQQVRDLDRVIVLIIIGCELEIARMKGSKNE